MFEATRRKVLAFLGGGAAVGLASPAFSIGLAAGASDSVAGGLPFTPVRVPHPLPVYTRRASSLADRNGVRKILPPSATAELAAFDVVDDLIVPPEFERYVIVRWGDRVFPDANHYVGYNNDFTGFVPDPKQPGEGMLWINHEFVSHPFSLMAEDLSGKSDGTGGVFETFVGFPLPPDHTHEKFGEMLYNLGGSAVRLRRENNGRLAAIAGHPLNRRLHGLSGLAINAERSDHYKNVTAWGARAHQIGDTDYLIGTGPAATDVFARLSSDGLGNSVIGTAYSCAGTVTPWGTVLVGEESTAASSRRHLGVQNEMRRDGTQTDYILRTTGFSFGLVGEKYGWIVEIDPADPGFRARKHTALGRFRHENVALRTAKGQPIVAYMGDDRSGGHVWRYVSSAVLDDPTDRDRASKLLEDGTLYVARFDPPAGDAMRGTGTWIPIHLSTPTAPLSPSTLASAELAATGSATHGGVLRLPRRRGVAGESEDSPLLRVTVGTEADILPEYRGKTVADFYDSYGAVLCDAYAVANLVGGTPSARPETLAIHPTTGEVFIAFTSGRPDASGYPDSRIFLTGKYDADVAGGQPFGGLYKIVEDDPTDTPNSAPTGTGATFVWERVLQSGEAGAKDGAGFANIDNIAFTAQGDLLCLTDVSNRRLNGFSEGTDPAPVSIDHAAVGRDASALAGVFGNNWAFIVPAGGPEAGAVVPLAMGPMHCELTGPTFVDGDTLLLSVQHPGKNAPFDRPGQTAARDIEMLGLDGRIFTQRRTVPVGSNWPSNIEGAPDGPPRPAVVGIRRKGGGRLL